MGISNFSVFLRVKLLSEYNLRYLWGPIHKPEFIEFLKSAKGKVIENKA